MVPTMDSLASTTDSPAQHAALAEAVSFGSSARRLATDLSWPLADRLRLAVTLAGLLVDAQDPQTARSLAWPWLSRLLEEIR